MKPKNLKFPFTWEERKPAVHEGILIVPQYYDHHDQWEIPADLFPKDRPISIEFCSGNGDWVIEKAVQNPGFLWVAVEMQFERVRKIWSKMRNQGIENLLIVCGEAFTFAKYYLKDGMIQEIFVNFPDPWPKDRHAKHRLIQEPFVEQLSRIVKRGGKAIFATDDPPYSMQMIQVMQEHPNWASALKEPYYEKNWEDYGDSWFKNLWKEKGRDFYYMAFNRL